MCSLISVAVNDVFTDPCAINYVFTDQWFHKSRVNPSVLPYMNFTQCWHTDALLWCQMSDSPILLTFLSKKASVIHFLSQKCILFELLMIWNWYGNTDSFPSFSDDPLITAYASPSWPKKNVPTTSPTRCHTKTFVW